MISAGFVYYLFPMPQNISTAPRTERAILIGISGAAQREQKMQEYLDELAFLTQTAGAEPVRTFTQKLDTPVAATFVGSGKLEEIKTYVQDNEIDLAIFDDELTPTQLRNIENTLSCKILDRTHLILDIFARRAKTSYAKNQVELAQYQYLLPRLTRMWTHLERQQGGIGMRGPGETEIETDRRIIRQKISKLKLQLKKIDTQMALQRKNRGSIARVALVGYTNVGKSTLMNLLSHADVFAENKLFATLDTTVRKVVIQGCPMLLTDTVGFIRKLPHHLVESFKSTLDEVREADLLLHVVDISHPGFEEQMQVVEQTLCELNVRNRPTIIVFNKIDGYLTDDTGEPGLPPTRPSLSELQKTWMADAAFKTCFISAKYNTHIELLKDMIAEEVRKLTFFNSPQTAKQR